MYMDEKQMAWALGGHEPGSAESAQECHESLGEHTYSQGHALMAEWSKALSLTGSCLSPLPGFFVPPGHV